MLEVRDFCDVAAIFATWWVGLGGMGDGGAKSSRSGEAAFRPKHRQKHSLSYTTTLMW
jgi:hypothetical protein